MSQFLFDDNFKIVKLNENGKKFERVNRLHCKGTAFDVDLVVDVNCELFPVKENDNIQVSLSSTLGEDFDDTNYNHNAPTSALMDSYDYIMHGRVFNILHCENQRVEVHISFGGLLLKLKGEQAQMEAFLIDNTCYILMRKSGTSMEF